MSKLLVSLLVLVTFSAVLLSASPVNNPQSPLLVDDKYTAPPNLTHIARLYMNFGAEEGNYTDYNCTAWAQLWNDDGVRQTPGVPPSKGWDQLTQMCQTVRSQFTMLFCDASLNISVTSYNGEKRMAFEWMINGVLASTGEQIQVPVITALFMDSDGTIQTAWDFLDPSSIHSSHGVSDSPNLTEIARVYMNFGGFPNYPHAANCSQWAALFGDAGIRNTPGVPPVRGYDNLVNSCQTVRGQFETLLNFASLVIPVTSWDTEIRVAFVWSIEGMTITGNFIHKPVITTLFMDPDGTIQNAWDFLDPHGIEP
jgi:hypothetical protein